MSKLFLVFILQLVGVIAGSSSATISIDLLLLPTLRGGSVSSSQAAIDDNSPSPSSAIIRVAYQGEPGAYSEKATRELLGPNVFAVGRPSFEAAFRAVASMEVDYACLPVENSLGGSIHENYDLMLRYQLYVQYCLRCRVICQWLRDSLTLLWIVQEQLLGNMNFE